MKELDKKYNHSEVERNKYDIDEIVIAIPSAEPADVRDIITICQDTKARVRRLPAIASTLTDSISSSVRDVNYEDLLGRDSVIIRNSTGSNQDWLMITSTVTTMATPMHKRPKGTSVFWVSLERMVRS